MRAASIETKPPAYVRKWLKNHNRFYRELENEAAILLARKAGVLSLYDRRHGYTSPPPFSPRDAVTLRALRSKGIGFLTDGPLFPEIEENWFKVVAS